MGVEMGEDAVVASRTRNTSGETCFDAMPDDQRFPQGPTDNEDLTDLKSPEFHSLGSNNGDAPITNLYLNAIPDSFPRDKAANSEERTRDVVEFHQKITDASEGKLLNPPAEREETRNPKLDVTRVRTSFEARLNSNAQETLKLKEELETAFQGLEHELQEQKFLFLRKEHEVTVLQRENQHLHELISKVNSRNAQVVELQDSACKIREELVQLRQNVINQLANRYEDLHLYIGKAFANLYDEKCGLQEHLRKCQMLLDSTTGDIDLKTQEIQQLKEIILSSEADISKLQQKIDVVQQQLCKEKAGQHGSYVDGLQTPFLVESTAKAMFSSINTFSSLLSKYKDSNGNNPVRPLIIDHTHRRGLDRVCVAREHHWTYLLKECVCNHLFENFEKERLTDAVNTVIFLDHEERVSRYLDYFKNCNLDKGVWDRAIFHESSEQLDQFFFRYFAVRCVHLLPLEFKPLKNELFQNYDEGKGARIQEHIRCLAPDKQKLVQSLIVAAGKVWQFHKLCLSFEPPATIFRVSTGDHFNPNYMESIDVLENDDHGSFTAPKVAFMIYPGFRLRRSIIKCQVYLGTDIDT